MEDPDAETVVVPQEDYLQFEVDDTAMDEPEEEAHLPPNNHADYTLSPPARFVAEAANLRTLCDLYHCSSFGAISGDRTGRSNVPSSVVGSQLEQAQPLMPSCSLTTSEQSSPASGGLLMCIFSWSASASAVSDCVLLAHLPAPVKTRARCQGRAAQSPQQPLMYMHQPDSQAQHCCSCHCSL